MKDLTSREFDLMRSYIEEECGIALGKEGYLITSRLSKILTELAYLPIRALLCSEKPK